MRTLGDSRLDAEETSPSTGERGAANATLTRSRGGPGPAMNLDDADRGAAMTDAVPPSLHARFEDFQLLGHGGMGVVYRARDLKLNRSVAIKLLFITSASSRGGLLQEARSQARLRHEHACEVYEAGIADHVPFIAMQLILGEPLSKAKEGMTLEEKVLCVRRIASALHEAHRLGMVHRDVKPGNILVERGDDGSCKPYIVDFGLARDVAMDGPTLTAGVQGTPSFMAPEQAAGDVSSIDRRTDVYGLGATLYDTLAGRPPFIGSSALEVMRGVMEDEPLPLHGFHRGLALDLSAIVMKCLEKDPRARYESAKALGEDLQRFLDGDPVLARPPSRVVVLWKRARRHKGAVLLVAVVAVAALIVAGLLFYKEAQAKRRAELARELGERVTEMEMFLRTAHGMPLHDVEREREFVRGRMRGIEARMAEAGDVGAGPGHDALGRGHLALGAPRSALEHFREAERAGYRSPGLDYATGVALIALYKQALESTKHIQSEAKRKARIAEIEVKYKAPAVVRLRASLGNPVAPAAYVEGLIALHEGREEDAVKRAGEAFVEAPWMHEAKKLEGDALFALGSRHRADKAFDYDMAMASFEGAARAYTEAADLGRSDPSVHAAECELWAQIMNAASEHGEPVRPGFERAQAACERAIAASPRSPEAYVALAWVDNCFAWWVAAGRDPGEALEPVLRETAARSDEAALRSPEDPMAHYIAGAVARTRAVDALSRGVDTRAALGSAIAGYEAALRLDPEFVWALNELCSSLALRGTAESLHGEDPRASFAAAAERCERATVLDPSFTYPLANRVTVSFYEADHLLRAGRSPEAAVARGLALVEQAEKQNLELMSVPLWRSRLLRARAEYTIASGGDAQRTLADAEAAARVLAPGAPSKDETQGLVFLTRARAALARAEDAEEAIREALSALTRAVAEAPRDIDDRIWLAEAHLLEFRSASRRGRAAPAPLDAAFAALSQRSEGRSPPTALAPLDDPRVFATLAEVHAARASLLLQDRDAQEGEIERGLSQANEALAHHPRYGSALAVQGRLWLLRARTAAGDASRNEAASHAVSALEKALESNPLLARVEQPSLDEARRLFVERAKP